MMIMVDRCGGFRQERWSSAYIATTKTLISIRAFRKSTQNSLKPPLVWTFIGLEALDVPSPLILDPLLGLS